jgi:hypothetical protein
MARSLAGALLLLASASFGREYYEYDGTNNLVLDNYVNFYTSVNAGTDHWPMYTFGAYNVKYYDFAIGNTSGAACYEIETIPTDNDVSNYDSRIWTYNGSWKSLDDDNGQGLYSKARAFLNGSANLVLWFSAYSDKYNTMKFEATIKRLNLAEAACTTGQSLPWIKISGGVTTYSANAN